MNPCKKRKLNNDLIKNLATTSSKLLCVSQILDQISSENEYSCDIHPLIELLADSNKHVAFTSCKCLKLIFQKNQDLQMLNELVQFTLEKKNVQVDIFVLEFFTSAIKVMNDDDILKFVRENFDQLFSYITAQDSKSLNQFPFVVFMNKLVKIILQFKHVDEKMVDVILKKILPVSKRIIVEPFAHYVVQKACKIILHCLRCNHKIIVESAVNIVFDLISSNSEILCVGEIVQKNHFISMDETVNKRLYWLLFVKSLAIISCDNSYNAKNCENMISLCEKKLNQFIENRTVVHNKLFQIFGGHDAMLIEMLLEIQNCYLKM